MGSLDAGTAEDSTPVTASVTSAESDIGENTIGNLFTVPSIPHHNIFRRECVSFSIAESIRIKVILMGRTTALPFRKKTK